MKHMESDNGIAVMHLFKGRSPEKPFKNSLNHLTNLTSESQIS